MDYLSHNISVNLRRIRKSKGMSLDEVSEQTGVSKSMLHQIEKGIANPSINVLGKIASGLRTEFNVLIAPPPGDTCLVNTDELQPTKENPGEYAVWTCFPYEDNRKAEIYRIDIEPGAEYVSGGHGEGTVEYIAVLAGELTLKIEGKEQTVRVNDVIRFDTSCVHSYANKGTEKMSCICVFVE